jgi:eukaryotic-like serine/threonine-protein kinase
VKWHAVVGVDMFSGTGRYEIVRRVGEGGMGVVYQALDRERQTTVALKTLRHVDASSIFRLKREFRALSDVSHPNLVALRELQCVDGQWFFTMEFIEGINFLSYVRKGYEVMDGDTLDLAGTAPPIAATQLDVRRLRGALAQLVKGVEALHQAGKLHRDIKPSNVLVTVDGRVVILDFGLVTDAIPDRARLSMDGVVGTAAYMAPEQAASAPLTAATDWYAVGAMMYEALTGRLPFEGSSFEIMMNKLQHDPPAPRTIAEDTPADLDTLCVELLRRRPEERPPSPEIQRRLGALQSGRWETSKRTTGSASHLVGRERHLAELFDAFAESPNGASAVFVRGSSGMGKSALVRRFLELVGDDAVVLRGRCYERESVPYKGFDRAIDELSSHLLELPTLEVQAVLPRDVNALTRVFPVLRRVAVLANARRIDVDIPDAQELRRRAFAGLRELFSRLSDRRRVILYIDDLQWGDLDSLSLLIELMRQPEAPPLLLVGCYRSEDEATSEVVRGLPRGGDRVHEISVDQLIPEEAFELARSLLDARDQAGEAQARVIARESGGSPFFVGELVRHVEVGEGITAGDLTLDQVLRARLARLPPGARRLLEVLALHGRPLAPELALRAAELTGDGDTALAQLRVGNLTRTRGAHGEVEPYHDRIRETVAALIRVEELPQRHARLAAALEAYEAADPEALAVHYRGAGDQQRAGHWARIAARQATEALAFDRAARLYRLALELHPGDDARALQVRLGEVLVDAGRGAEAARAFLAARDDSDAVEARILTRRAAEQLLFSGHIDEGRALLREVLRALGMDLPRSQSSSLAALLWGRVRLRLRGRAFRERDAARVSPELLERVDTCWSVGHGLGMIDVLVSHQFHTRHLLLALAAGEPHRIAYGLSIEPTIAGASGDFARADALTAEAGALAERIGNMRALGITLQQAATVEYMRGQFKKARPLFERSEQIFRERCRGAALELAVTQALHIYTLYYLGELARLEHLIPKQIREAEDRGDLFASLAGRLSFSNIYWVMRDEVDEARREANEAIARWSVEGFHVQHFAALTALVNLELYRGDGAAAWRHVEAKWSALKGSILYRVQSSRLEAHITRIRAALGAAQVDTTRRPELLGYVEWHAKKLDAAGYAFTRGIAALCRAGAAALRDERERTAARLDEAIGLFDGCDLALYAAAARHRRGRLIGGDEGGAQMSAAEQLLTTQRVRAPARIVAMLAPGFGTLLDPTSS